jgi:transcriptional regulator with XRE-family HTH domain
VYIFSVDGLYTIDYDRRMTLKALLEAHGMTQPADLADVLEIDRRHAWLIWWGKQGLSRDLALKLYDRRGIPLDQLLRTTGKPTKDHQMPKGRRPGRHRPPHRPPGEGPAHE